MMFTYGTTEKIEDVPSLHTQTTCHVADLTTAKKYAGRSYFYIPEGFYLVITQEGVLQSYHIGGKWREYQAGIEGAQPSQADILKHRQTKKIDEMISILQKVREGDRKLSAQKTDKVLAILKTSIQ